MFPTKQDPISKLIFELSKLPGVGERTATRLTYFLLKQDDTYARSLAEAILNAKKKIVLCGQCFTFTDVTPCSVCSKSDRDQSLICVLERPADLFAIEQSGTYRGVYHVLHGSLSPLEGVGPMDLKIQELLVRLKNKTEPVREVIFATNPSVEGEATALFIAGMIRPLGLRMTKLAHGLPVGGLLEYTDRQTIGKAIDNRMEMN